MQQLTLVKRNRIEWRDAPEVRIDGPGQALVKPLAVARCDLDLPIIQGHTLFRPPFPLGHEFVGEITATSEDLTGFAPGQKVAVAFQVACGSCPLCTAGRSKSCANMTGAHDYGMGSGGKNFGGALSDLVKVPYAEHMLLPLPAGIDLVSVASLSDNIVEAWKLAGHQLETHPGTPVLILGGFAASIGLYTAGLATAMGSEVLYLDEDDDRCRMAESLGARAERLAKLPKSWERKFPLVVDASGSQEGYRFCIRSTAVEGTVTSASIFWTNDFPLPYMDLYVNGATLKIGRVDSREQMPKVLDWIARGAFRAGEVVSRVVDWQDALEAWPEPGTKLVVTRD